LENEARAYVFDHENIVKLHAVVSEPSHYGVVMEFVHFGGLDQYIKKTPVS